MDCKIGGATAYIYNFELLSNKILVSIDSFINISIVNQLEQIFLLWLFNRNTPEFPSQNKQFKINRIFWISKFACIAVNFIVFLRETADTHQYIHKHMNEWNEIFRDMFGSKYIESNRAYTYKDKEAKVNCQ